MNNANVLILIGKLVILSKAGFRFDMVFVAIVNKSYLRFFLVIGTLYLLATDLAKNNPKEDAFLLLRI